MIDKFGIQFIYCVRTPGFGVERDWKMLFRSSVDLSINGRRTSHGGHVFLSAITPTPPQLRREKRNENRSLTSTQRRRRRPLNYLCALNAFFSSKNVSTVSLIACSMQPKQWEKSNWSLCVYVHAERANLKFMRRLGRTERNFSCTKPLK